MSDIAIGAGERDEPFRARTAVLIVVIGILGFVGSLVLGAYAPDFRSGRNGGGHALSNAAVGFSGIVRLAEATGRHPQIVRTDTSFDTEDLVVLTPENGQVDLGEILRQREVKPTLVVLPKWLVVADPDHRGWTRYFGLMPEGQPEQVLAPLHRLDVARHASGGAALRVVEPLLAAARFTAPRPLQTVSGPELTPLITDAAGRIVVGKLAGPLFVLADPDLLSNKGMRSAGNAAAALALLDWLNSTGAKTIRFDVTLNGLGRARSPLRLAFEPPFLAMTLAVAVALLLAGWQASTRFGRARPRQRALAFGKTALIDNAAALIRKARRESALGGRYAEVVRERAAQAFGAPARLQGAALDAYLDRIGGRRSFSALAADANAAQGRRELLDAAQALHRWQGETKG